MYPTQFVNNCYNYALNRIDVAFRDPGHLAGEPPSLVNLWEPSEVRRRSLADGLIDVTRVTGAICPHGCWLVALVSAPPSPTFPGDYHWYRKDDDGRWSHKGGLGAVDDLDEADKPITDPRTCDRGLYTVFVGFFFVCPAKLK